MKLVEEFLVKIGWNYVGIAEKIMDHYPSEDEIVALILKYNGDMANVEKNYRIVKE